MQYIKGGEGKMDIISEVLKDIKKVLYYHYKSDINFPKSCGSVSMILAYVFQNSNLKDLYEISYKRGHFKNELEEDDCFCDENIYDFSFNIKRGDNLSNFCCNNCGCDYMVNHSWIELKSLKDNKITILDFTSIQFNEDFSDYVEEILNSRFNEDELYDYLKDKSKFIIKEDDKLFSNYLISEKEHSGVDIIKSVEDILKEKEDSRLTILLKDLNYLT